MRRLPVTTIGIVVLGCIIAAASGRASADFEVPAPDGRRILLKDDKTWSYVDAAGKKDAKGAAEAKTTAAAGSDKKDPGEAVLYLEGKVDGNRVCRYQLRLVNNLPYEIRSLVPEFSIYRANGVMYDSVFSGFSFLKPGDAQRREIRFNGIACPDIARVAVGGGDRCEMGELDKFSSVKGKCLSYVRVEASGVVKFDKGSVPVSAAPGDPGAATAPSSEPAVPAAK